MKEKLNNGIPREIEKPTSEHFAMEILKQEQKKTKAWITGAVAAFILILVISIISCIDRWHLVEVNQHNNEKWIELFSSYDYMSQDGEGVNNIKMGTQGDVTNIPNAE
ncbi:MAG: hypothetical protein K2N34_07925 [Lachnospiraceae bacterium]|nr:hypothetical protein [Lachnospiraceae bacterium]